MKKSQITPDLIDQDFFTQEEMKQIFNFFEMEEKEREFQKANMEKAYKAWSEVERKRLFNPECNS